MNIKRVKRICLEKEYISFDVFDTLIERKVLIPSDIFLLTGRNILGKDLANRFRYERIFAEMAAREKSDTHEVSLKQIYDELTKYDDDTRERLLLEEIHQERENARGIEEMVSFYNTMLAAGKKCVFVSDMYLSKDVICDVLIKNGLNIVDKDSVFISSEYGCSKLEGKLFNQMLEKLNISSKSIVHIGDSIKADYLGARRNSIESFLCLKKHLVKRKIKSFIVILMAHILR